jgi:heme-degrading monooxygenase HmoA
MGTVYVSVSRLRVEASRADELVAAFRQRAHRVDDFEGFLRLEVWRSDRDPEEVLMVSHWESGERFGDYTPRAEHRVSHDRIPDDLAAAIRLERLEHVQSYEVVAG